MVAHKIIRLLAPAFMMSSCMASRTANQGWKPLSPGINSCPMGGTYDEFRFTTVQPSVVNQAMLGVDPLAFDHHGKWNPGLKDQIFNAMSSVEGRANEFYLNNFIGRAVQDVHCPPLSLLSMRTLSNYNSYRYALKDSVSFESRGDVTVRSQTLCATLRRKTISYLNDEESKLVEFFRRGGEVVLGEALCQTHTVSVNLNVRPTFTTNFLEALRKLCFAAGDSISEKSSTAYSDFVDNFGTHYQETTNFGSRLLIMKLFVRKAANFSESSERHRCVSSSLTQNLALNSSMDEIVPQFRSAVSRCVDSKQAQDLLDSLGLSPILILTVGTMPLPRPDFTLQRPVPIHYKLEKISSIFHEEWFESLECSVNRTVMQNYFENTSTYQNASIGTSCEATKNVGCGYNSRCKLGEICSEDNSTKEGFLCGKVCLLNNTCPNNTICVDDDTLDGFSCKKGCQFTGNCAENTVCIDDDTPDGFSCKKGCQYTASCAENTVCMDDDTPDGFSCKKGCGYTANCAENTVCVDDDTLNGFSCKKGCQYTGTCAENTVCVNDDTPNGFSCKKGCLFTGDCSPQQLCKDDNSTKGFTCREACMGPEICAPDETCYAEQHSLRGNICVSTKQGRAVMLGGSQGRFDSRGLLMLNTVETVNFKSIPELPIGVESPAAAALGDFIVLCGGWPPGFADRASDKCFKINYKSPGTEWKAIPSAPDVLYSGSAVSIGKSTIWFFGGRDVIEFDGETHTFTTHKYSIGPSGHCSVSNGTHAYVVGGRGGAGDQIWVSEKAFDGPKWRQVARLKGDRHRHACLWYGSNIMITGGEWARSDVEMFNTETEEVWAGQDLLTGRHGHQMMLLDGMPTVVGGFAGTSPVVNSFEFFSLNARRWEKLNRNLKNKKYGFALVEV